MALCGKILGITRIGKKTPEVVTVKWKFFYTYKRDLCKFHLLLCRKNTAVIHSQKQYCAIFWTEKFFVSALTYVVIDFQIKLILLKYPSQQNCEVGFFLLKVLKVYKIEARPEVSKCVDFLIHDRNTGLEQVNLEWIFCQLYLSLSEFAGLRTAILLKGDSSTGVFL